MSATTQAPAAAASKNLVLATFAISIIALAIGAYALTVQLLPSGPAPGPRTFRISIDWLNSTSGTTPTNRFTPDTITAIQGDTVTLNVTNRAPIAHGFSIDGLEIRTTVDPGTTFSVARPNLATGVYTFYCQLHTPHLPGQLLVLER